MALIMSHNLLAQTKTWTGTSSTNWATPANWSPSGVPATTDEVIINNVANDPQILSGTVAGVKRIVINLGAILTVNSGGNLTISGFNTDPSEGLGLNNGSFINNGTVAITSTISGTNGIQSRNGGSLTNGGIITITTTFDGIASLSGALILTNNSTGVINIQTSIGFRNLSTTGATITNNGQINYNGSGYAIASESNTTFNNYGSLNINNGNGISNSGSVLNNFVCGKIILNSGNYANNTSGSTTTNNGLIQLRGRLDNTGGIFHNNGVIKYGSLTGTITNNNGSVRVNDNPTNTSIFTYTGTFAGTVNGIFTNATATTSAGTFTAPNTFVPGSLPSGNQTLYAKITPSGSACFYVVPFTYFNCNITLTAGAITQPTTCRGTGSIAFTSTNLPNGTYSLSFTPTGSGATTSPQNITFRVMPFL